jgi:hypothetical protein
VTLLSGQTLLAQNDDWDATLAPEFAKVGAFAWTAGSKDAALIVTLPPGAYTAQVNGKNRTTGMALVEVYDADGAPPAGIRLLNISTLSPVGTGAQIQTAGFVIDGPVPKKIVIRAAGPSLSPYGIQGLLADPVLTVLSGQTILAQNDDWPASLATDFAKVGAFSWTVGSKDAAVVITLPPGAYTAQVTGKNNTTGMALVEVYDED